MAEHLRRALLLGVIAVTFAAAFPENRGVRRDAKAGAKAEAEELVEELAEAEAAAGAAGADAPGAGDEAGPGPEAEANPLGLPANASALLPGGGPAEDSFSCDGRGYGYYADPANGCRIFHVCLPLTLPSATGDPLPVDHRFSFICPEQTLFNQEAFTCTRPEDSIPCDESPQWYHLNEKLGRTDSPAGAAGEAEANPNAV